MFVGTVTGDGIVDGVAYAVFLGSIPAISQNQQDALNATPNTPNAANPYATIADITAILNDSDTLATIIAAAGITPATGVPTNATNGIVDAAT